MKPSVCRMLEQVDALKNVLEDKASELSDSQAQSLQLIINMAWALLERRKRGEKVVHGS